MLSITGESAQVITAAIAAVGGIVASGLVVWSKKQNTTEHGGTMDALQRVIVTQARVESKVDTINHTLTEHIGWHKGHGDTP